MNIALNDAGLSEDQVTTIRLARISNTIEMQEERVFLNVLKEVWREPMFILLLADCIIYFAVDK